MINKELNSLNKEQYKAATTFDGPLMILAGAGSGKTKTVITRTANMITKGIPGSSILVLTFTNKAANEMKERGEKILSTLKMDFTSPTFTNFHSWCLKFIKNYISYSKEIQSNFTIADENLSESILSDIMKDIYGDIKGKDTIKPSNLLAIFSIIQNNLISYENKNETLLGIRNLIIKFFNEQKSLKIFESNLVDISKENQLEQLATSFVLYKEKLRENNLVDFDDLINLSIDILQDNKEVREHIQNKYNYIMVDEFQDTNYSQITLLDLILNKNQNICVVGDDSQSIYGWRGAEIQYILNFHKKYKNCIVINLTENYRSSENIVLSANTLIDTAEEKHSLKEKLKAFKKDAGEIHCIEYEQDYIEAQNVAKNIKSILNKGVNPNDIAILYRSNFVVNSLEKELIKEKVPYQIFKGRSILQRKSAIEFMNLINCAINEKNILSLTEFLTSTSKIVSEKRMNEIISFVKDNQLDLVSFLKDGNHKLLKSIKDDLFMFFTFMDTLRNYISKNDMFAISDLIVNNGFLFAEYQRIIKESKSEATVQQAESSLNNLYVLISLMTEYNSMEEFFDDVVLSSETESSDTEKVNLMTVHASKGLEFEYVFVVRFNNGVFPSSKNTDFASLQEEKRLAYVAITRAKKYLSVSYALKTFGKDMGPSPFIREAGLLQYLKKVKEQKQNVWVNKNRW